MNKEVIWGGTNEDVHNCTSKNWVHEIVCIVTSLYSGVKGGGKAKTTLKITDFLLTVFPEFFSKPLVTITKSSNLRRVRECWRVGWVWNFEKNRQLKRQASLYFPEILLLLFYKKCTMTMTMRALIFLYNSPNAISSFINK